MGSPEAWHLVDSAGIVMLRAGSGGLGSLTPHEASSQQRLRSSQRGAQCLQVGCGGRCGGDLKEVWRHFKPAGVPIHGGSRGWSWGASLEGAGGEASVEDIRAET